MSKYQVPEKAEQFVVTAVYHEEARSDRDEGCMKYETFVFKKTATIEDVFKSVYAKETKIGRFFRDGRQPVRIVISPDENTIPISDDIGNIHGVAEVPKTEDDESVPF